MKESNTHKRPLSVDADLYRCYLAVVLSNPAADDCVQLHVTVVEHMREDGRLTTNPNTSITVWVGCTNLKRGSGHFFLVGPGPSLELVGLVQ